MSCGCNVEVDHPGHDYGPWPLFLRASWEVPLREVAFPWVTLTAGVLWIVALQEPPLTGLSARLFSWYPSHPKPRQREPSENSPWSELLQDDTETTIKPLILLLQLLKRCTEGRPSGVALPALPPLISVKGSSTSPLRCLHPLHHDAVLCCRHGSLAGTSMQPDVYAGSPIVLGPVIGDIKGRRHCLRSPTWPRATAPHVDFLFFWGEGNEGGSSKINRRTFCFDWSHCVTTACIFCSPIPNSYTQNRRQLIFKMRGRLDKRFTVKQENLTTLIQYALIKLSAWILTLI